MTNKKRLIDAVRLRGTLDRYANAPHVTMFSPYSRCMRMAIDTCIEFLDMQRTVDAVEVVRCKDCKSWEQYNACDGTKPHRCMNHDAIFYKRTNPDDFCSYGERKDNERKAD